MSFTEYKIIAPDGLTQATIIPERGGYVSSLIMPFQSGARETLFLYDYAWDETIDHLPGGIPFVFPICARISRGGIEGLYLYDGKQYQLKIHGFSWFEKWDVLNVTKNSIEMVLKSNSHTVLNYPFLFEIQLRFEVHNGKLECHQCYKNTGKDNEMPYYAGFHPYFLTAPLNEGKENTTLSFKSTRRLQYNETLTDIIGEQSIIKTPIKITDPRINEQLSILGDDKCVTLTYPNGEVLKINAHGIKDPDLFSYLQLYHIPEKPFFCIEHWMGFPNAMNTVAGVRWLKPGEGEAAVYEISIH